MMAEAKNMLETALDLEKSSNSHALSLIARTALMLANLCNADAILTREPTTLDDVFATLELAMNALEGVTTVPKNNGIGQDGLVVRKKDGGKGKGASDEKMDLD